MSSVSHPRDGQPCRDQHTGTATGSGRSRRTARPRHSTFARSVYARALEAGLTEVECCALARTNYRSTTQRLAGESPRS
jgi:hypothetical protein